MFKAQVGEKKIPKRHSRSLELGHNVNVREKKKKPKKLIGWGVGFIGKMKKHKPLPVQKKTNVEDDKREHL